MTWKTTNFVALLVAFMLIGQTRAWLMHAVYHNSAHPGKCFVNENLILSPGQVAKSPEGCSEIHCGNAEGHAQVMGAVGAPENCRWDGLIDESAPFPLCCIEKFVCNSPADEENARNIQNHLREMFKQQVEEKRRH